MLQDALQNVAAGKRHLLVADPNAAVTSLALACEQLGTLYGETSKECGEAYFYYGKALLELARLEAGVIDEVLDGGNFTFFIASFIRQPLHLIPHPCPLYSPRYR
jgi:nuclear autoantigenic sperm protein